MSQKKIVDRGSPRRVDAYRIILFALMGVYTWIFAGLAFAQHAGMRTHKADLGQIAQAVWNSSRGRFVEMTDNGFIATRMTDHVEPILALVSPVLWLWRDTRALLLLQVVAVALGAWLLYELALLLFKRTLVPAARRRIWETEPLSQMTRPLALALAVSYLLAPQLQSALLTEFHAVVLAVPLILWALWAVEARRWWQFSVAVILVALVKEESALLAMLLGLWAIWRVVVHREDVDSLQGVWRIVALGATLAVVALGWFYLATFVIVPAYAVEVYGIAESSYFQRYGALGSSPVDILRSFFTQPALVWSVATEPARLEYLRNLLTPFGWLALLAPEVILLGAPVLLANQLSAYPAQYYSEFHYSAPVVVYFAAASAFGLVRLWRWTASRLNEGSASFQHLPAASAPTMAAMALFRNSRTALRPLLALALVIWLLGWSVGSYVAIGRGPGGGRYDPTPITAHHRLLPRFLAQLPSDAAVTATAAVHPHVSLRRYVYQFPMGLQPPGSAEWALLDVTTATDMAPGDVHSQVEAMLAGEWGVVDGADGFLLLHKGEANKQIPPAFYDFARTPGVAANVPLALIDAAAEDWRRWRATQLVTTWQVGEGYDAATMAPAIEVRSPSSDVLYRFADAMPPALVWYPPTRWQSGDRVHVTTLPLYLPRSFGMVVERTPGLVIAPDGTDAGIEPGTENERGIGNEQEQFVLGFQRGAQEQLVPLDITPEDALLWLNDLNRNKPDATVPLSAQFRLASGEPLTLTAQLGSNELWAGAMLDVNLAWQGSWQEGMVAFVHLRQAETNQGQQDGLPRYFVVNPPPITDQRIDWRQIQVPPDAAPGEWQVVVGLYDPATGTRLPVVDDAGTVLGEEVVVGTLRWRDAPVPDQSCALIPASCASQVVE